MLSYDFMKPTKPFFSIIIPAFNEETYLPILLASLKKQTFKNFEVIIVDDGSTDNTYEKSQKILATNPAFKYLKKHCKSVSAVRNYGAKNAQASWLIFLDADGELETTFLTKIKEKIHLYDFDIATVWNRGKKTSLKAKIILLLLNIGMILLQKITPAVNGPCIIIKKTLFVKIGGFDEKIIFGEDFELSRRAHRQKAKFALFSTPKFYLSTRRFDKEGLCASIYKAGRALLHQLFFGPIRQPIFDYEMGGQYYQKK